MVKNLPANAGDTRDAGSIPGLARSPGEGNGYALQYSCPENPMDGGAWGTMVPGVAKSQTRLKRLSLCACLEEGNGNPLQYSCPENPRDGGAWWVAVYGVAQSQTRLKRRRSSNGATQENSYDVFSPTDFLNIWTNRN